MEQFNHIFGQHFSRKDGILSISGYPLSKAADAYGTPVYIYDFDRIRTKATELNQILKGVTPHSKAFFAVKALGNLSVLKLIHAQGLGMDVVSGGEIERCLAAGIRASEIIFSGVAKSREEITLGVSSGIGCFNIESPHEVNLLSEISAKLGRTKANPVHVALRINPDVDGKTHKKINTGLAETKFGLNPTTARALAKTILQIPSLKLIGVSCHIGSQLLELSVVKEAALQVNEFATELMGLGAPISHIDMGGGLGVNYHPQANHLAPSFAEWVEIAKLSLPNKKVDLHLEPGRSIVGDAGVLITKVIDVKVGEEKNFALVDAGMTEMIRPALYDAYHHIVAIEETANQKQLKYDVVGPVCETSCILGEEIILPELKANDYLAILTCGAYGMSMASNYNSRQRPPEIAIENQSTRIIRQKETLSSLWESERIELNK